MLSLQGRKKWSCIRSNIERDDIVFLKDEEVPRNQGPLVRVTETFPSSDGLVHKATLAVSEWRGSPRQSMYNTGIERNTT